MLTFHCKYLLYCTTGQVAEWPHRARNGTCLVALSIYREREREPEPAKVHNTTGRLFYALDLLGSKGWAKRTSQFEWHVVVVALTWPSNLSASRQYSAGQRIYDGKIWEVMYWFACYLITTSLTASDNMRRYAMALFQFILKMMEDHSMLTPFIYIWLDWKYALYNNMTI